MKFKHQQFPAGVESNRNSGSSHPGTGDTLHALKKPMSSVKGFSLVEMPDRCNSSRQHYLTGMGMTAEIKVYTHFSRNVIKFG